VLPDSVADVVRLREVRLEAVRVEKRKTTTVTAAEWRSFAYHAYKKSVRGQVQRCESSGYNKGTSLFIYPARGRLPFPCSRDGIGGSRDESEAIPSQSAQRYLLRILRVYTLLGYGTATASPSIQS